MTFCDGPWGGYDGGLDPWLDADDAPAPGPCPRCGWQRAYPEPEPCVWCGFGDPDEEAMAA